MSSVRGQIAPEAERTKLSPHYSPRSAIGCAIRKSASSSSRDLWHDALLLDRSDPALVHELRDFDQNTVVFVLARRCIAGRTAFSLTVT
jgi:hypothetical protein